MKQLALSSAKKLLSRLLPSGRYNELVGRHYRRKQRQFFAQRDRLSKKLIAHYGNRVLHGPFKGIPVAPEVGGDISTSQVLGSYEEELHDVVFEVAAGNYDAIVNLGCASGYYLAGFARLFPAATIWGFDINPESIKVCLERAQSMRVDDRTLFGGRCTHSRLNDICRNRTLIFCDIEGGEKHLLEPAIAPNLKTADLIVELHDFVDPTISEIMKQRFSLSHEFKLIEMRRRDPSNYPELSGFSQRLIDMAFSEQKLTTTWGLWKRRGG